MLLTGSFVLVSNTKTSHSSCFLLLAGEPAGSKASSVCWSSPGPHRCLHIGSPPFGPSHFKQGSWSPSWLGPCFSILPLLSTFYSSRQPHLQSCPTLWAA